MDDLKAPLTPFDRDRVLLRAVDDIEVIKTELAEWRGAIRLVRYGASLLGVGGIMTILVALLRLGA